MKNWKACGSEKSTATWVTGENNIRVCTMNPSETDWENCQLIAAAPDLLAALEAISPMFDNDNPLLTVYDAEIKRARAAIAKAKGL